MVHPHGRGDNNTVHQPGPDANGSPPRAWGQCFGDCGAGCGARFTPTGVGTMARALAALAEVTVHPHGRGDNRNIVAARVRNRGSPPRAWGQ